MAKSQWDELEVILRIKRKGIKLTDMIVRGQQVEVINYFPSGEVSTKETGSMPLQQFLNQLDKITEK